MEKVVNDDGEAGEVDDHHDNITADCSDNCVGDDTDVGSNVNSNITNFDCFEDEDNIVNVLDNDDVI